VNIYILVIFAEKRLRYGRVSRRKSRSGLRGEGRDIDELIGTNMGPTISFADFLVKNNFSINEFHDKLEEVYRQVYFS
jgi:dephospho-CoA kinase